MPSCGLDFYAFLQGINVEYFYGMAPYFTSYYLLGSRIVSIIDTIVCLHRIFCYVINYINAPPVLL